jgi:hypothetical protein
VLNRALKRKARMLSAGKGIVKRLGYHSLARPLGPQVPF